MAISQATTRQPSLITPLTSLISVLDLTGKIIDFNLSINRLDTGKANRSFQQQEKRWSTVKQVFIMSGQVPAIFVNCVNAAPCRQLAWGKESVKCEKLYQPHRTRPDHNNLDHCHQTGPVSGGTENVCQTTKCDAHSACRIQAKSVLGTLEALGAVP